MVGSRVELTVRCAAGRAGGTSEVGETASSVTSRSSGRGWTKAARPPGCDRAAVVEVALAAVPSGGGVPRGPTELAELPPCDDGEPITGRNEVEEVEKAEERDSRKRVDE